MATVQNRTTNNVSGGAAQPNPYAHFYKPNYGYVFGKPFAFIPRTDPNQRVFQSTMLRNNTILNIIPGKAFADEAMLNTAKKHLEEYDKEVKRIESSGGDDSKKNEEMDKALQKVLGKLQSDKVDLRFATFKQDSAAFIKAFMGVLSYTATAIFASAVDSGNYRVIFDVKNLSELESRATRGFKVWVEKGTSVSESIDNSFTQSFLDSIQKEMSNMVKQLKFLGMGTGMASTVQGETTTVESSNATAESVGTLAGIASRTAGAATFDFPQIFDESKFNRSYEVSFRFVSPYGDDKSVYDNVITPLIFLLTCALPRQDGPSGHKSPFLVQVDAPGFFSCPMGVVSTFSFRKGGDEMLFNDRGLPLVVEGTMSIMDLYSNLSLPLNHSQFATNFGTAAFFSNMGGMTLYSVHDPNLKDSVINSLKSLIRQPEYMYNRAQQSYFALLRFLGATS